MYLRQWRLFLQDFFKKLIINYFINTSYLDDMKN